MQRENPEKSICILIPTFNRVSYLRILLEQLRAQVCTPGFKFIPLIIVDGSADGTLEMLSAEFPSASVLRGTGDWWWTKCINEGAKYAIQNLCPDYLLLMNDDSQIQPGYLSALIDSSKLAQNDCIIGSLSVTEKTPHKVSFSGVKAINWFLLKKKLYFKSFELLENIPSTGLFPTYALNGRGTLISSSLFQKLTFLNERSFPQYGSDDDLALRAWKKGHGVYISYSCKIYDRTHDTSKGSAFRQDAIPVFVKSFFTRNSVNYIPKQFVFFYYHGIKILMPFYLMKFILGTSYAYFFKYKKMKYEL